MMKRYLVVFALCLFLATTCVAQKDQPATIADIQRYFVAAHIRDMAKKMTVAMAAPMRQMIHNEIQKNPGLPPDAEERMIKNFETMIQNFPFDDFLSAQAPIYAKHFTKGDVDALVAFYSSPTGQKFVTEMPAITAEAMQAALPIMQKYMTQMQQQVHAQIAQMQKDSQSKSQ
jgi:hypothetical protein